MFWYSKIGINLLSLIITIIIFSLLNFFVLNFNYSILNIPQFKREENANVQKMQDTKEIKNNESKTNIESQNFKYSWEIIIPEINLSAPISEGTTKEVMDKFVGHFIDTGVIKNNICLGAHNRGYSVNYFENIKNLKEGDLIYYKKDEYIKTVENMYNIFPSPPVSLGILIRDTDWTYLENTDDTRITLITCVENEPDYRRCVQAIELKEEK